MTTAVMSEARPLASGAYDRVFYTGMAILMTLTVFAGFARTYYLRSYFGGPATISGAPALSPVLHVHAVLFTSWMLLFIVQTALVAGRQVKLHRQLGVAGVLLSAVMVAVGAMTAVEAAARGAGPGGIDPLAFLVVPIFDITLFAGFVTAAVVERRNKEAHKRLMLLAFVSIVTAGVARLPYVLSYGPLLFFGL